LSELISVLDEVPRRDIRDLRGAYGVLMSGADTQELRPSVRLLHHELPPQLSHGRVKRLNRDDKSPFRVRAQLLVEDERYIPEPKGASHGNRSRSVESSSFHRLDVVDPLALVKQLEAARARVPRRTEHAEHADVGAFRLIDQNVQTERIDDHLGDRPT